VLISRQEVRNSYFSWLKLWSLYSNPIAMIFPGHVL
jgi:hypothetical protein